MKKRFLWSLAFFILILMGISSIGCERREKALVFAVGGAPNEVDYWERLIKKFEKKEKIHVKIVRQPTDTDQRRQSLIVPLKGKMSDPDVFLIDVAWIAQFAASGWLCPLDEYIKRDKFDIKNLFSQIVNQVDKYKGRIIALPVYIDCGVLYFRKDLIKKYNCSIPATWDELIKCAKLVQKAQRKSNPLFFGFLWQGAQYEGLVCNFLEFATSNNGGVEIKDGRIKLFSKENLEALTLMRDLIKKFHISPPNTCTEMKEEETRILFEQGNALFERNWPYAWRLHEAKGSSVKGKVGVALLPGFYPEKHACTLGGWHIGISKYSDMKDAAWEFVKFVLSYEIQKGLALELGWNPVHKKLYFDEEIKNKLPYFGILQKAIEFSVARPAVPYYPRISEILQREINAAISGRKNPEEALKEAQRQAQKVIEKYK